MGNPLQVLIIDCLLCAQISARYLFLPPSESLVVAECIPLTCKRLFALIDVLEASGSRSFGIFLKRRIFDICDQFLEGNYQSIELTAFARVFEIVTRGSSFHRTVVAEISGKVMLVFHQLILRISADVNTSDYNLLLIYSQLITSAISLGLPLLPSQAIGGSCLLDVFSIPERGRQLFDKFEAEVTRIVASKCLDYIAEFAAEAISRIERDGPQNVALLLLERCLRYIHFEHSQELNVDNITKIVDCFDCHLDSLPRDFLFLLARIDARIPKSRYYMRNSVLRRTIIAKVTQVLEQPHSTTEDIIFHLQYLPFLLAGGSIYSKQPIAHGYEDDFDTRTNVQSIKRC